MTSVLAVSASAASVGSMTAWAADPTYTITMTSTTGHTYAAFQIFTGDLSETTSGAPAVTTKTLSNIAWGSGVNKTNLIAALKADTTYGGAFTTALSGKTTDAETASAVANQLAAYKENPTAVKALADIIGKHTTGTGTATDTTDTNKIKNLAAGYYLIKDTTTTLPTNATNMTSDTYSDYILEVVSNVEVGAKDSTVESHKTVTETDDTAPTVTAGQKVADYDIGDDIPYELTFKIPSNYGEYSKYYLQFVDEMSKGLTYKTGSATIKYGSNEAVAIADADIVFTDITTGDYNGGKKLQYTISDLKSHDLGTGDTVTINYKAILNSNAEVNSSGNTNKYHTVFSNNPTNAGNPSTDDNPPTTSNTPDDTTVVFTYELVFNKIDDQSTPQPLKGADFKLEKNVEGTWTEVTALHNGTGAINPTKSAVDENTTSFTFHGLDAGKYRLTEIQTPKGYNTIAPIEFTVTATKSGTAVTGLSGTGLTMTPTFDTSDAKLTAAIKNNKGVILPTTGGVGTTIFYIIGGLMISGALVLLIVKKRMSIKEK